MTELALNVGLSFLEGLALIVSPCILPILPLILSASVDGGRRRPFGIIVGFILAFGAFALLSRWIVSSLGIDLDLIKNVSLVFLAAFGLILLSSTLSNGFSSLTQGAASWSAQIAEDREQSGFFGGLMIGALIGVVWTPCAGPILAAVLVQVIRQGTDVDGALLLLAFSVGAALPMLLIALMGRKIMDRLGFFKKHAEGVRKVFGFLILLAVAFIASGQDVQSLSFRSEPPMSTESKQQNGLIEGLASPYAAPDFVKISTWMNSKPLTMEGLKGKVVLVDFWTYSCINCIRTLPTITAWDRKYRDQGLVIVGVHAPEFAFEQKEENVRRALGKYNITYPVALDNGLDTWSAYHNRYWPAHYLIDREGLVVYTHFGEGKYEVTEHNIRTLLGLSGNTRAEADAAIPYSPGQTPETYLGTARAERTSPDRLFEPGIAQYPAVPSFLPSDHWTLVGKWEAEAEKVVARGEAAALRLNFTARKVFLVMGTETGKAIRAKIVVDGNPQKAVAGADVRDGFVIVDHNGLYEILDQQKAKNGLIEIQATEPGLEAYAFTFGE